MSGKYCKKMTVRPLEDGQNNRCKINKTNLENEIRFIWLADVTGELPVSVLAKAMLRPGTFLSGRRFLE